MGQNGLDVTAPKGGVDRLDSFQITHDFLSRMDDSSSKCVCIQGDRHWPGRLQSVKIAFGQCLSPRYSTGSKPSKNAPLSGFSTMFRFGPSNDKLVAAPR